MPGKRFDTPVAVDFHQDGHVTRIASARDAAQLLMDVRWPERGPMHEAAVDTCLKVLDGHRSTIDAHRAFREAALEAGILRENLPL